MEIAKKNQKYESLKRDALCDRVERKLRKSDKKCNSAEVETV